jgi:Kef-type K+ transport system membrane component KefB
VSHQTAQSIFVIMLVAVAAPMCAEVVRRFRIPSVLFELLLGIIIGPEVLGWAHMDQFVSGLSTLGLSFLFFMAGYEINFGELGGQAVRRAGLGWLITLALALAVGSALMVTGYVVSGLLVGLCLTTTAIGTLLPMLRDRNMLDSPFGRILVTAGIVGEFAPVVAVTVLLGTLSPGIEALLLIFFVAVALTVAVAASRPQPPSFSEAVQRHLTRSTQLPVRFVLLLVTGFVVLASVLNQEILLGAFASGLIAHLAFDGEEAAAMQPRLEAVGFGFLIPVFFIVSGMEFHASELFSNPSIMARVPIFLGLMLIVRGVPALLIYSGLLDWRRRASLMFLQSTALPLVVVITGIGLAAHKMRPENAIALVGAGMLSVLIFPIVGFALAGSDAGPIDVAARAESDPADDLL